MKIVLASDTHGLHNSIRVPHGEVLIHAGDLSSSGTDTQVALCNEDYEPIREPWVIDLFAGN